MKVRIQRSVAVKPEHIRKFIDLSLTACDKAGAIMGVEPELFYNAHRRGKAADFRIFTDFDSLKDYEELFLERLLMEKTYHEMGAAAVDMVEDEPRDELFVRLEPDDYFMNLGAAPKRQAYAFEAAPRAAARTKPRYRRIREFSAAKGRLQEVMRMNFDFIDQFHRKTQTIPDYFCTRFATSRIGSSNMYFDHENCPMCTPSFLEQDELIRTKFNDLLLSTPGDILLTRITPADASFTLRSA